MTTRIPGMSVTYALVSRDDTVDAVSGKSPTLLSKVSERWKAWLLMELAAANHWVHFDTVTSKSHMWRHTCTDTLLKSFVLFVNLDLNIILQKCHGISHPMQWHPAMATQPQQNIWSIWDSGPHLLSTHRKVLFSTTVASSLHCLQA